MDLTTTLILFACELAVFGLCLWRDRQPPNPAKPRLFPYRLVMLTAIILLLTTLAHIIALVTGNPVLPRRKMGT